MATGLQESNIEQKMIIALEYFKEALLLSNSEAEKMLKPYIKIVDLEENQILFEEGNTEATALGIVISGVLKLTRESDFNDTYRNFENEESSREPWCAYIHTRELIGGLQV
jgi:5'-3' exonuclease